jgi:hypothetical protein
MGERIIKGYKGLTERKVVKRELSSHKVQIVDESE